jgi:hypothetical protein
MANNRSREFTLIHVMLLCSQQITCGTFFLKKSLNLSVYKLSTKVIVLMLMSPNIAFTLIFKKSTWLEARFLGFSSWPNMANMTVKNWDLGLFGSPHHLSVWKICWTICLGYHPTVVGPWITFCPRASKGLHFALMFLLSVVLVLFRIAKDVRLF